MADDTESGRDPGGPGSAGDPSAAAASSSDGSTAGTYVVTHADDETAVLREVDSGRVRSLASNPGVAAGEVVEGVIEPEPPLGVTDRLVEIERRREIEIEESQQPPTARTRELAAGQAVGELTRDDRAGDGEIHVLTVPDDGTDAAVADVLADREVVLARAARLGVRRVEVRSAPGVVSVRYLP